MRRKILLALGATMLGAALPGLAQTAARPQGGDDPRWSALQQQAQGFSVGPTMAARTAYVFFDAQCPHCATLWVAARPLEKNMRMVWIPVRLLGPSSLAMGAAILGAPNPAAAMDEHERIRAKGGRGIDGNKAVAGDADKVQANTALFARLGQAGVPVTFYRDRDGQVRTFEGATDTASLRTMFGLQ
jgi:thiol:disulfide interchange protein DsbG